MSILLISSRKTSVFSFSINPNYRHYFPVNRVNTFQEMLLAGGLRCDIQEIENLQPELFSNYQIVVVCAPFKAFSIAAFEALNQASKTQGLTVVSDSWLLDARTEVLFGVKSRPGYKLCKSISDRDAQKLYSIHAYPHSEEGFAFGVRPLIRLLLQNWIVKRLVVKDSVVTEAYCYNRAPAILTERYGLANNVLMNFHPSLVFKNGGLIHAFFRRLLIRHASGVMVGFDLSKTACLRMDDPGSCERVHLETFNCGVIAPQIWQQLRELLARWQAKMNIAYVPVWVDDGDPQRGTLVNEAKLVEKRIPGQMFASWKINYNQTGREHSHHYADEYQEIKRGVDEGVFYILSHGLTHISTYVDEWLKAEDRYTNMKWYREFREMVVKQPVPETRLVQRLEESRTLLAEAFGSKPDILVPSAHEQTLEIPKLSAQAGFKVCSSRATFLLHPEIKTNRKIKAFYPTEAAAAKEFCAAGFPVIYTFHDYDVYKNGSQWLQQQLEMLQSWGIERFVALDYLCALLSAEWQVKQTDQQLEITICFSGPFQGGDYLPIFINRSIGAKQIINGQTAHITISQSESMTLLKVPVELLDSGFNLHIRLSLD